MVVVTIIKFFILFLYCCNFLFSFVVVAKQNYIIFTENYTYIFLIYISLNVKQNQQKSMNIKKRLFHYAENEILVSFKNFIQMIYSSLV